MQAGEKRRRRKKVFEEMRSSHLFPPTSSSRHCQTIHTRHLIVQVYRRLSPAPDIPNNERLSRRREGISRNFGVEPVNPPASKMAKDGRIFNDISSSRCSSLPLHRPCRGPGVHVSAFPVKSQSLI
ncbi:hypothetical protein TWF718_008263 [Orbilia javanica]|uniref:Uncharacterized protein n=1 Tax=Orbilia javanica TaxID=47235 RepID=A0AAN8RCZ3_9PEZI